MAEGCFSKHQQATVGVGSKQLVVPAAGSTGGEAAWLSQWDWAGPLGGRQEQGLELLQGRGTQVSLPAARELLMGNWQPGKIPFLA